MKLADLKNQEPPDSLVKLDPRDYEILWHSGFWDGPTSDMLRYEGNERWFNMIQENEASDAGQWYRRFAVVRLTPEQLDREHKVREDFARYVGMHSDYVQGRRSLQGCQPKDQHHRFYDEHLEYCRSRNFENSEVIAWFQR